MESIDSKLEILNLHKNRRKRDFLLTNNVRPYYAIKSLFPPGIANMPDGRRFAIAGVWVEIGPEVTLKMLTKAWEPLYPRKVEKVSTENVYEAVSPRTGEKYKVKEYAGNWSCSCPGFEFHRGKECRHIKEQKSLLKC